MASGTRIERLYLSLGLDLTEFDTDLAGAQAHVRTAANQLNRDLRLQRLRMEIDLAGIDNAGSSVIGLSTKMGHLRTQMETQRNAVALLNHAYQESVRQLGADATASQRLQERLTREQLAEARLEAQIRQTNTARRERVTSAVNTGIDNTAMILAPTVAMGAAALHLAVDAVESENLWSESMGSMVNEGNAWATQLRDDLGLNEVELKKSTGMLNTMFDSMGMGTETSYMLSTNLAKLGYDMASFYNLDPDVAFEKLRAGMTGESEPLKALGINISENTIKNYAYTHSIADQGAELTDQQKVLASYYAIMEKTKRAQGDMARTLEDPANAMRVLKSQVERLGTEFGQSLIPALKDFVKSGQGMVKFYNDADAGSKLAMNSIGKLAIEVGAAATGLMALNMAGLGMANPYLAIAGGIALATKELAGYLKTKKEVAELKESESMGNKPSPTVAKTRVNPYNGYREKEVEFDGLFGKGTRWQRFNDEENAQQDILDEKMKRKSERRAQLDSIIEKSTGKPLTKASIDEILDDEFDENYSTEKWQKKFERDQEQLVKKQELEEQAAAKRLQANRDLSSEISKLENSDYKNAMVNLNNKVADYKKAKLDEVNIARWAELEKKKAIADAQKEYLSDLDKMRQAQIDSAKDANSAYTVMQNKESVARVLKGSITDSDGNGVDFYDVQQQGASLVTLENMQVGFDNRERQMDSARLREKLEIIQAMTEGEERGSKRRKELLEQEVQASNEYTKSLVSGVKSAMQDIENLQNKAMSASSQALSLFDKFETKRWNFATDKWETTKDDNYKFIREVGDIATGAWNSTSNHSLAQMGQMLDLKKRLADSGVDIGIKIDQKDIIQQLRTETAGIPTSIEQAKASMADFYQQIGNLGSGMTQQYFAEWREQLNTLKSEICGDALDTGASGFNLEKLTADTATMGNVAAINFFNPWHVEVDKLTASLANMGGVSGRNTVDGGARSITVNAQNSIEIKGFTADEIKKAVEQGAEQTGKQIYDALQDANAMMGM